jgi:hypothetical protein
LETEREKRGGRERRGRGNKRNKRVRTSHRDEMSTAWLHETEKGR